MTRAMMNLARKLKRRLIGFLRPKPGSIRDVSYRGAKLVVFPHEDVGWGIIWKGNFEGADLDVIESLIRPGDTCVDIGANLGLYSVFMGRRAIDGEVLAFEPLVLNRKMLELNCALNGINNVTVHPEIVSDSPGELEFSVSADGAYSSILPTGRKTQSGTVVVRASTLDEKFSDRRVDIVKLDVEGAELRVLRGGRGLFSDPGRRPRAVLVELAADNLAIYDETPQGVIDYMRELGYEAFSITPDGLKPGWPQPRGSENALFMPSESATR